MHAYAVCEYVCVSVGCPYSDTVHRFCFFVVVGITSMSATLQDSGDHTQGLAYAASTIWIVPSPGPEIKILMSTHKVLLGDSYTYSPMCYPWLLTSTRAG